MEEIKNIFLNVVKNNYKNFSGRARRREFWMFQLAVMIVFVALGIVSVILGMIASFLSLIMGLVIMIFALAILVPSIALAVRRVQDVNKEWFFILIPVYNFILMIQEGDKGANQFGEDPKA